MKVNKQVTIITKGTITLHTNSEQSTSVYYSDSTDIEPAFIIHDDDVRINLNNKAVSEYLITQDSDRRDSISQIFGVDVYA